jgi:DNA mismatch endonuclease, patch repair protein
MRANKSSNSKPELLLRMALREAGYPGYRLYVKGLPGRPDISYVGRRVAIFVHGCFWHRCEKCGYKLPKVNRAFWRAKFKRNIERDAHNVQDLTNAGWKVITVWECEVLQNLPRIVKRLVRVLDRRKILIR